MLSMFQESDSWVWLHLRKGNYIIQDLECELPTCHGEKLVDPETFEIMGYRFRCPKRYKSVTPYSFMASTGKESKWSPFIGLPGIQIFTSDVGTLIVSLRITKYYESISGGYND